MRTVLALLLFLACSFYVSAAPPTLTVPETVEGEAANYIKIVAKTDGKDLKWVSLSKDLKLLPAELLKDNKTAIAFAGKPGKYRLLVVTALADELSEPKIITVVVVGPASSCKCKDCKCKDCKCDGGKCLCPDCRLTPLKQEVKK